MQTRSVMTSYCLQIQWNPDLTNLQGKRKLVRKIGEFEKSGVELQRSTEEWKLLLVRVIRRFEKLRVREIGIPLYWINDFFGNIEAVFLKLGTTNVHHKINKMTPLVLLPWQQFCRWCLVNKNSFVLKQRESTPTNLMMGVKRTLCLTLEVFWQKKMEPK